MTPIAQLLDSAPDLINDFSPTVFELGGNTMATATVQTATVMPLTPRSYTAPTTPIVVPLKLAWFGEQGTGKTTSAALLAAALSKEHHGGAPVWVTDPELGWKFPKRRIFAPEKIELVQRTTPTFKAMMDDIRAAERAGACVWAVELGAIWKELLKTVQARCGTRWGQELVKMWDDYINLFKNSNMHCMAMGRVSDITDDVQDEQGNIQRIKVAEAMKAGGRNNFGYEPDLVIRMSLEIKPRRKGGVVFEAEGRMNHRAHILKDRTWELNGDHFSWSDRREYKAGDYRYVWRDLRPHYLEVQATSNVKLDTAATSDSLIANTGNSEYYEKQQRKDVLRAELKATIEALWGGSTQAAKDIRRKINEQVFGWKSNEAVDAQNLDKIERGVRIMQAFEKRCKADDKIMGSSDENILANLDIDIAEFDQGKAEDLDLPF
jgi:hypothetical protein